MKNTQKPTIEEILNFNFSDELDLELLPKEEQEKFNANLFGSLMERIIKKTSENLTETEQSHILDMVESEKNMDKIFKFIEERNGNFVEEIGKEFLDFKSEIYDLLKN